jgi:pSer/pThr/pTyr-binding forkhead associated (FHA) protein
MLTWLIWQDVRGQRSGQFARTKQNGRLIHLGADLEYVLETITSLGRSELNTVQVNDHTVSSEHALITFREGHWWLEDLRSRNGTTLNGQLLTSAAVLTNGDLIGIGDELFRVEIGSAT